MRIFIYLQFLLPQKLLSIIMGKLGELRIKPLKNCLITLFIKYYKVDLSNALHQNLDDYPHFNSFFIRPLKAKLRPIAVEKNLIASPVDGNILQAGTFEAGQVVLLKKKYFNFYDLLAHDSFACERFKDGDFSILYLAPACYHRIHMPFRGQLLKTLYVPGQLFSVNALTAAHISNIYSRNERLIALFATDAGMMAIIMVGAMIVGNIQTAWQTLPAHPHQIITHQYEQGPWYDKGSEIGYFKMGSTVMILWEKNKISWLKKEAPVHYGEAIGKLLLT